VHSPCQHHCANYRIFLLQVVYCSRLLDFRYFALLCVVVVVIVCWLDWIVYSRLRGGLIILTVVADICDVFLYNAKVTIMTLNQRSTIPPHNFLQRRWPTTATARTSKIASSLCQPVSLHNIWISLLLELRSPDTCTCSPCPSSSTVSSTCWLLSPYLSCTCSCAKIDA
jgi:hypothetical protein